MMTDCDEDFEIFTAMLLNPKIMNHDNNPVYTEIQKTKNIFKCRMYFLHYTKQSHKGLGVYKIIEQEGKEVLGITGLDENCPVFNQPEVQKLVSGGVKIFLYCKPELIIKTDYAREIMKYVYSINFDFVKAWVKSTNLKCLFFIQHIMNCANLTPKPIECKLGNNKYNFYILVRR